ncbi:MAG: 50S ribosomal protein L5, partial [Chloroflexi bacterium]|nr:50S ribosomal protein L5 [Chloroflexota bacterium]
MAEKKETKTKKKPVAKAVTQSKTEKPKAAAKTKKTSSPAKPAASKKAAPKAAKAKAESKPKAAAVKAPAAEKAPKKAAAKTKVESFVSRALPRLQEAHRGQASSDLTKEFSYTSPMQVPTVKKIVVNIGLGEALTNAKAVESATGDVTAITGQKPIVTKARKSIAGFKIRE